MNQKRQPKGTNTGGQFAPDVNAESTVVLDGVIIAVQRHVEINSEGESLDGDIGAAYLADGRSRLQRLTECAYAVDEAIDVLTRWDGGSGADPADVLAHLVEVREEIFAASDPQLVEHWRDTEAKIRGFENDPDSSPLDDDGYEVARDEREALFQKIYEEAWER
jgi:hypothetical protein